MTNYSTKLSSFDTVNATEFSNKNYNIKYDQGAIQVQGSSRKSSAFLFCVIILLSFILLIPFNKTVKHPSFDVTTENLSTTPFYQSYIEDIQNEPIPQFTELLERVGDFSGNVALVPALSGFQNGIIQDDWGFFNFAKGFINYLTYPFIWGYNIISSTWQIIDLFI